jgi:CBS domain containing-hemolysin-like protein
VNRRGLSETVAVLALIVAAVAIAVILGIFSSAFTRNVAVSERIDVSASLKTLPGGAAVLRVSVRNVGDANIQLTSISVTGGSALCSSTSLPSVAPGQVIELVLDCTGVSKYSKYVVVVKGLTPAGNQIESHAPVTAE